MQWGWKLEEMERVKSDSGAVGCGASEGTAARVSEGVL